MQIQDIITTEEAKNGFYPTPQYLIDKMLEGIDYRFISTVLEPSAGKGNLIDALFRDQWSVAGYGGHTLDVDICEIDPYLRQICKYNFGGERVQDISKRIRQIEGQGNDKSEYEKLDKRNLERQLEQLKKNQVHIVHDDFLTYRTFKHYDLILMNPPFSNGEHHLLHALDMQKHGGSIICLLNAETIRNPYTSVRKLLVQRLQDLNAEISFAEDAFEDAERKADVDVAIIKVHIAAQPETESAIWEKMEKATSEDVPDAEMHDLISVDYIKQAIRLYQTEVAATLELVKQYKALVPHILRSFGGENGVDKTPILSLIISGESSYSGFNLNSYLKIVRLKYWQALFSNKVFTGKLTSELQDMYRRNISRMADYEFSAFNIQQIIAEMNVSISGGIEKAILDLFDKLTFEHSWYPECAKNRHYFNGWAANKAHKIGKKCIIPTSGMFSIYSWYKESFDTSEAYKVISDIEKAFDYLDMGQSDEVDLLARLKEAAEAGQTRNIQCKYFAVDLYKKGTTHIKFYPESMHLVERLNIYASRKKGWLPPNYGRTAYQDLDQQEKAVVDSFHGDGTNGAGEEAYTEVLHQSAYYLTEPTQQLPALTA